MHNTTSHTQKPSKKPAAIQQYPYIEHHGAVRGVTGSCHQLWLNENHSLLIDCGLFQGNEGSGTGATADRPAIDFNLDSVHALVLTHVHIDHVGRLPWLLAAGFSGQVHCTEPSALLLPTVLEDAFLVGVRRDVQLAERFVGQVAARLQGHPYKTWHTLIDTDQLQCRIRFQRAGHILGSAWVECDVHYPQQSRRRRILFSGDLGAPHAPLLPPPDIPWQADVVVLESTYGDRLHEDRRSRRERLRKALQRALADGGTVLVPAFSIGRTQELLYELEDIFSRQAAAGDMSWSQLPVILDAPLAQRFTRLYRELRPWWAREALKRVAAGRKPLGFEQLLVVETHAQHQSMVNRLAHTRQPAVVISGNGMCSAGRIVNYLKAMLGDPRHNLLLVGYQAEGTPGRVIQSQGAGGIVRLDGEDYRIALGVETLGGYSAHADQKGLCDFITRMRHWPEEVRLVHGSRKARQVLADTLREKAEAKGRSLRVVIPGIE